MNDFLGVLYQSLLSFFILFLISKLLGKKQVAQLEFTDYVVGISIGSIAAQMATEPDIPWFHFVVAMSIYAFFDLSITFISRKSRALKKIFKGKPLIIINQGKIDYKMLKKSKLDINELESQCRVKGFFKLDDINYCFFEPSGDFSILPKSANTPTCRNDFKISKKDEDLSLDLVIDGKIVKKHLIKCNKDEKWILKKCKMKNLKMLKKNILLMTLNLEDDSINIHYKK